MCTALLHSKPPSTADARLWMKDDRRVQLSAKSLSPCEGRGSIHVATRVQGQHGNLRSCSHASQRRQHRACTMNGAFMLPSPVQYVQYAQYRLQMQHTSFRTCWSCHDLTHNDTLLGTNLAPNWQIFTGLALCGSMLPNFATKHHIHTHSRPTSFSSTAICHIQDT